MITVHDLILGVSHPSSLRSSWISSLFKSGDHHHAASATHPPWLSPPRPFPPRSHQGNICWGSAQKTKIFLPTSPEPKIYAMLMYVTKGIGVHTFEDRKRETFLERGWRRL